MFIKFEKDDITHGYLLIFIFCQRANFFVVIVHSEQLARLVVIQVYNLENSIQ